MDVHRLSDGQVKHSPEVFYAGSLWKVFEYHLFILVFCALNCYEASNYLYHAPIQIHWFDLLDFTG